MGSRGLQPKMLRVTFVQVHLNKEVTEKRRRHLHRDSFSPGAYVVSPSLSSLSSPLLPIELPKMHWHKCDHVEFHNLHTQKKKKKTG